ncbi:SET domain-containing protein [Artomyces pyxidatus]|uniref:SET domain-containing protein n=1 Tax=Artomyces pyxidatus TaxID=48021 RepID=A0ACB8SNI6_9AGAM|nr:SET domain-containing protein [Artomyces pyxidatus]
MSGEHYDETLRVRLDAHPTARTMAVARSAMMKGETIVTATPLSTALLPEQKGRRCDFCHILKAGNIQLFKCSGCASYWYCGSQCDSQAWSAHHKRICKFWPRYVASTAYDQLPSHLRMDAILLSQLGAQYSTFDASSPALRTLFALMPSKSLPSSLPSIPITLPAASRSRYEEVYHRFANNNFILHSHLVSFGHGIYPLASRLFNHSCTPNAVVRYVIAREKPVQMQVVALRDIREEEEVCIPYIDPALPLEDRDRALDVSYGFRCTCPLCTFQRHIKPSTDPTNLTSAMPLLKEFTGCFLTQSPPRQDTLREFNAIPEALHSLFNSTILPNLAEAFSQASHNGSYATALDEGLNLLALYILIYPPNYPQTGLHALEVAKTAWNAIIIEQGPTRAGYTDRQLMTVALWYLAVATHVLGVMGREGDEGGPLTEIEVLQGLVRDELASNSAA